MGVPSPVDILASNIRQGNHFLHVFFTFELVEDTFNCTVLNSNYYLTGWIGVVLQVRLEVLRQHDLKWNRV